MTWQDWLWTIYLIGFALTFVVVFVIGIFARDGLSVDAFVSYTAMASIWPICLLMAIHYVYQFLTVRPIRLPPEEL